MTTKPFDGQPLENPYLRPYRAVVAVPDLTTTLRSSCRHHHLHVRRDGAQWTFDRLDVTRRARLHPIHGRQPRTVALHTDAESRAQKRPPQHPDSS